MKKNKIIIGTSSKPVSNLGGPGKFTPFLFKSIIKKYNERICVLGIFDRDIVYNVKEICYNNLINNSVTSSLIHVVDKFPYISVLLRKIRKKIKFNKIIKKIKKEDPDLLHLHDFEIVASLSKINKPIIFTNHFKGSLYEEYIKYQEGKDKLQWKMYFTKTELEAIERADIITFPSISAMNLLINDFKEKKNLILKKHRIIYTGIDDLFFTKVNNVLYDLFAKRDNIVLNISNHIPDKGIEDALMIFAKMLLINKELRFINIGANGVETPKLREIVKKLHLEQKVHFLGVVNHNEVIEYLAKSRILLHTPKRVVFDLVLLEAMSFMLPIVASKAQGNVEALGNDHPFYTEDDSIDFDLFLIDDLHYMYSVAKKQRDRYLSLFTTDIMLKNYYDLYVECIDKIRPGN